MRGGPRVGPLGWTKRRGPSCVCTGGKGWTPGVKGVRRGPTWNLEDRGLERPGLDPWGRMATFDIRLPQFCPKCWLKSPFPEFISMDNPRGVPLPTHTHTQKEGRGGGRDGRMGLVWSSTGVQPWGCFNRPNLVMASYKDFQRSTRPVPLMTNPRCFFPYPAPHDIIAHNSRLIHPHPTTSDSRPSLLDRHCAINNFTIWVAMTIVRLNTSLHLMPPFPIERRPQPSSGGASGKSLVHSPRLATRRAQPGRSSYCQFKNGGRRESD